MGGVNMNNFSTRNYIYFLNPWFVTGLVDAEGSFMVNIIKNNKLKIGWRIILNSQISLHNKDRALL